MKGSISEEALNQYNRLVAEKQGLDFAEGDTYDFTTCIRSDGSAYGTGGTCRKGTEGEAKVAPVPPKSAMTSKDPVASALKAQRQLSDLHKTENAKVADLVKAGKVKGVDPGAIERIQKQKLQDAASKGDPKAIKKLEEMDSAKVASAPAKRQLATSADAKSAWQESEKAVKAAKANLKTVGAETKGDQSPGARERRRKAAEALEKEELKALKASDKFFAARKREERSAMTPAQRKLEREADQLTKGG